MGVSGLSGDPMYPPKQPRCPSAVGLVGETVARGFNALGWHWWPSDSAIISPNPTRGAKVLEPGPPHVWLRTRAKSSTDITYWPDAIRGCGVAYPLPGREITLNDDGFADGVYYYKANGEECFQRAEVVVMACNGVVRRVSR
ncbi:MAG: hypothetical protein Ct9H300mP13_8610 [Gammaproteobacteria bacterium]|nr:MAG: hypothetical protein Ct9H300mP13_8610 [Gammaproteobacteria bacterium]